MDDVFKGIELAGKATPAQIDYLYLLRSRTGADLSDDEIEGFSKKEASNMIEELKASLEDQEEAGMYGEETYG